MKRREFLRWSALALPAIAGCASIPKQPPIVDRDILAQGLRGLVNASRGRWVAGHAGAAVIATYYFCRENPLDERTLRAVRANLDAYVHGEGDLFRQDDLEGAPAAVNRIAETLSASVFQLRSGGHDAIFGSLALKALRDLPEMATAPVVDGVCALLRDFAGNQRVEPPSEWHRDHPLATYQTPSDVVRATLKALDRPAGHFIGHGGIGAGNGVHWMTHADALVTLSELGYDEVARLAGAAHRQYINREVSAGEGPVEAKAPWADATYWEGDEPRKAHGRWGFGHVFKLPYSVYRLARLLPEEADRAALFGRAAWLARHYR